MSRREYLSVLAAPVSASAHNCMRFSAIPFSKVFGGRAAERRARLKRHQCACVCVCFDDDDDDDCDCHCK